MYSINSHWKSDAFEITVHFLDLMLILKGDPYCEKKEKIRNKLRDFYWFLRYKFYVVLKIIKVI